MDINADEIYKGKEMFFFVQDVSFIKAESYLNFDIIQNPEI